MVSPRIFQGRRGSLLPRESRGPGLEGREILRLLN